MTARKKRPGLLHGLLFGGGALEECPGVVYERDGGLYAWSAERGYYPAPKHRPHGVLILKGVDPALALGEKKATLAAGGGGVASP